MTDQMEKVMKTKGDESSSCSLLVSDVTVRCSNRCGSLMSESDVGRRKRNTNFPLISVSSHKTERVLDVSSGTVII